MSEEILYIDDGGLVYYINENEFFTCDEIPMPMLEGIKHLQQKVEQLEKENDKLKHKLNDIAFGDDSELALRFLRRIGYVGFDEKRKVYINKHNNEPFLWKDEQEKDYYLKDEELNEYTQQLEYKVEQLENIRKEATEFMKENCDIITTYKGWIIRSELTTTGLGKLFKILNKGGISKYE